MILLCPKANMPFSSFPIYIRIVFPSRNTLTKIDKQVLRKLAWQGAPSDMESKTLKSQLALLLFYGWKTPQFYPWLYHFHPWVWTTWIKKLRMSRISWTDVVFLYFRTCSNYLRYCSAAVNKESKNPTTKAGNNLNLIRLVYNKRLNPACSFGYKKKSSYPISRYNDGVSTSSSEPCAIQMAMWQRRRRST